MSAETKAMLNTLWKTFVVALIAQFVALGGDVFSLNMENAKTILGAAVAAAVMFIYNYLSKGFALYGNGSTPIVVTAGPDGAHEITDVPAADPAQPVDPPVDNAQDTPPGA